MELKVLNCFCTYSIELIFLSTPYYAEVLLEADSEAFKYRKLFQEVISKKKKISRILEKWAPIANRKPVLTWRFRGMLPKSSVCGSVAPSNQRAIFFLSLFFSLAYRFN